MALSAAAVGNLALSTDRSPRLPSPIRTYDGHPNTDGRQTELKRPGIVRRQSTMLGEPKFDQDTQLTEVFEELTRNMHKNTRTLRKLLAFVDNSQPEPDAINVEDESAQKKRMDVTYVEIMIAFIQIEDIDTLKQHFVAEIMVQAKWEEKRLADMNLTPKQWKTFDFKEKMWNPRLEILNIVGEPITSMEWFSHSMSEPGYNNPLVIQRQKIKAVFSEPLELEYFPIDSQELNVQISTRRSMEKVVLVEESRKMSCVELDNFMDKQEFHLFNCVVPSTKEREESEYEDTSESGRKTSKKIHSQMNMTCYVARRPNFYVWNILLVMFMIVTLSFTCFSIAGNASASRLVISLTLLLTVIAFKFVVSHHIPQVSYLTYLEIYILAQLVFLVLISVENAFIAWIWEHKDEATAKLVDYIFTGIFGGYYFIFHFVGLIYLLARRHLLTKELVERETKYLEQKVELDRYRFFQKPSMLQKQGNANNNFAFANGGNRAKIQPFDQ